MYEQRIVCAAVRHPDGRIVCGPRHLDETMWRQILKVTPRQWEAMKDECQQIGDESKDWGRGEQGFIDQRGDFLTREEAWPIADAAHQIRHDRNWQTGCLHSEHLY